MSTPASWPSDVNIMDVISDWLRTRRWFPASFEDTLEPIDLIDLSGAGVPPGADPSAPVDPCWITLVRAGTTLLQVPCVYTATAPRGGQGVIDKVQDAWLVDGTMHPTFIRAWMRMASTSGSLARGLGSAPVGGVPAAGPSRAMGATKPADPELLDALLAGAEDMRPLGVEQSNTSVLVPMGNGESALLKVIRILHAGENPDVEIPLALRAQGWEHVPEVIGHVELPLGRTPGSEAQEPAGWACSGVLTRFVPDAEDGFDLMVGMASRDEDPTDVAAELGRVTGQMHAGLATAFGLSDHASGDDLADRIEVSLQAAAAEVPELDDHLVGSLLARVADLRKLGELEARIRVHGDYHLGQTLRSDGTWYVLDFEGEPLRALEERRAPDLAMRDVAGMMRSFDYAGAQATHDAVAAMDNRLTAVSTAEMATLNPEGTEAEAGAPSSIDHSEWVHSARDAFIDGYTEGHGLDDRQRATLLALEIDKAVYEVVYEHRLRPSWMHIPLDALRRIAGV